MTKKHRLFISPIFLILLTGKLAMATEEPTFTASLKEADFEVRSYPALLAAQVSVSGSRDEASSAGFKLLAGYIFGANTSRQKLDMTAPVVQSKSTSQTIAMTAPVTQIAVPNSANIWTVRFTMPAGFTLATLPIPNDDKVQLLELPPARYAVVTFSGLAQEGEVAEKTTALTHYMEKHALRAVGPPALARYNPPWTPWFMRRNEVQIALAP